MNRDGGKKYAKQFNLRKMDDLGEYQKLLNDAAVHIIEEYKSFDKMGSCQMFVKWINIDEEPTDE